MRGELAKRCRLLWWSVQALVLASACLVLGIVLVAAAVLVVVWMGLPMVVWTVALTRPLAEVQRRQAGQLLHAATESPYLAAPPGNLLVRFRGVARDPANRRDAWWLLVNGTVGLTLAIIGIVEGVVDLLFWWLPPGLAMTAHARLSRALLSTSEKSRLALRVQQLTESRAQTVDTQAAELRRIERDLHDGAQARLVSMGMTLALADSELGRDPVAARALIDEAREANVAALRELRDLVRGIHPPVLADRGLVGAVQALALLSPIAVQVDAALTGRLPAPVESAAYFAVAEALTNAIKHSATSRVTITISGGDDLVITVRDNGVGGADTELGTGLRGIAKRLSAFDGTLAISSPPGGPTELAMVLPCVSCSPKTLPSSGTA